MPERDLDVVGLWHMTRVIVQTACKKGLSAIVYEAGALLHDNAAMIAGSPALGFDNLAGCLHTTPSCTVNN